ncbi:glycosyltransferase [Rhizobiales bacterium]|uniref:glycosyltransferase n=1 Tax=Hongsoonwoonella zoysiae TaxID=2821844 RepID=UPI00156159F2|nr:glycosyltransferase [Hongsoonwoonella zoysiae]NRG19758.1 glycosyltransferase [Hongsoonwoonella zoysiae]
MLSVIIPTLNNERVLVRSLAALVPAATEGFVRQVVVVDRGSRDDTEKVADVAGADYVRADGSLGACLAAGANEATRGDWLLFLNPGSVPQPGWGEELRIFTERARRNGRNDMAAVLSLTLDDYGWRARFKEWRAAVNSRLLAAPFCEQPLVISREFYHTLGGHSDSATAPQREFAKRIGRRRLVLLRAAVATPSRPDEAEAQAA